LDTKATINVSEGQKQSLILKSEGQYQAQKNAADGDFYERQVCLQSLTEHSLLTHLWYRNELMVNDIKCCNKHMAGHSKYKKLLKSLEVPLNKLPSTI
jgi:hypothetical protein